MFEPPDPELDTALELSKSDPQQAAQVLRIAANYLKNQGNLPPALAFFLADAFERAMKKASMKRGPELLMNLNLVVPNRRLKATFEYVGGDVDRLVQEKVPVGESILRVGENYSISESTVKRMHKKYLAIKAIEDADDQLLYEDELRHYAQPSKIKK